MLKLHQLIDAETGAVLIERLELAESIASRFVGWMFRKVRADERTGILLRPCRSIHTMWMRMRIDVAFLSDDLQVLDVRRDVQPWRIVIAPRGTNCVLESPRGQNEFQVGQKLSVVECSG